MNEATVRQIPPATTLTMRAIDAVDRAHARAASAIHAVRSDLIATLERRLERAEQLASTAIDRARKGVKRADVASADAVNRTQGVVGRALDKARASRAPS
ncbi:MAG: hypothetical protein WKG01_01990 [Kofleriaceae bacterium]